VLDRGTTLLQQLEVPVPEVAALAARARARGAFVLLNAAPALALPATLRADVDVLLVNETEAATYAAAWALPAAPAAFVRAMRERHAVRVVLTLGAAGALMEADGSVEMLAPPPVAVVDATGAGDAFAGALAAAFARGAQARAALAAALAAGARACTHRGAQRWPPGP
jgi:ribokinase